MLLPVFRDLIKPQWRSVIETLKLSGGMPVSEISRAMKGSYMTVKIQCDALAKAGYLIRTRLPRTAVGRPEIFYSLAAKSDALFPQTGTDFTLCLLDELRLIHGESAPEKLLFQHFAKLGDRLEKQLENLPAPAEKAEKLVLQRQKDGCASLWEQESGQPGRIVEVHNPMQRIFERYPRTIMMETRMIEQAIGTRVVRREIPGGRETTPRILFELT
ncbi:MAG: hypothetical protein Q8Q59_10745 [Luteolibacter sp.]|jgi:predicted ArsR family transcriptional regulator|nr:hypothetical protein [Luteolibacter sp.]